MAQGWYENTNPDFYKNVRKATIKEFALESMPEVNSEAWQRTLDDALKD